MANEIIVIQIMFIALGMVIFSTLLNRIFGVKFKDMKEIQDRVFNNQERMRNARALGDTHMMQELQMESVVLMKSMMKKQFIPMCVRCIIFMGIFAVIGFIYAPYDFWFMTYFLFSLLFSFSAMGIRYAYKKMAHKEDKTKIMSREIMGMLNPTQGDSGRFLQYSKPDQLNTDPEDNKSPEGNDSWKDRLSS